MQALLNFIKTQLPPESTVGMEIVRVDYTSRESINIRHLESGLTSSETGSLT
jgi:hypothetical protein